ncbi:hypothetical protein PsorP6_014157 [Peronosclerospora sorghi]|uniref:Uncharacterized protein n=1 Tax=Peronosclerospora sorghi TaxID=230839 RepID=A0ACC0VHW2_9STRA|nr:hypothetical protein PsorP6_014157 [Peronosclerospora sorghi]
MRQHAYNYFQHQATGSVRSLLGKSTFSSSLGRSPASYKRQRTLAEQMDQLCLQSQGKDCTSAAPTSFNRRRGREKRPQDVESEGPRIVEIDEDGQDKIVSPVTSGSDSEGMMDTLDEFRTKKSGDTLRRLFTARSGPRRSYMDKMYRHYVTVAAPGTPLTSAQGQELVLFRPSVPPRSKLAERGSRSMSLGPHEVKHVSVREKHEWYQSYRSFMDDTAAERTTEPPRKARDGMDHVDLRSSIDDDHGSEIEDIVMEEDAGPKCPHAAGALTHTEWFGL